MSAQAIKMIYQTYDYSMFRFWKRNRDAVYYDKIVKGIEKIDITEANPIIVNRNYYIIDGQNRFMACKKLGKPIFYVFLDIPDSKIDDYIIMLNTTQTNWRLPEYLNHYIKAGKPHFAEFKEFMEAHKLRTTHIGQAYTMFTEGGNCSVMTKAIRGGNMPDKWIYADQFATLVMTLPIKQYLQRSFVEAYKEAFKTFPKDRFNKLNKRIQALQHFAAKSDYIIAFNNLIDKRGR